jgi:hypothetical protein
MPISKVFNSRIARLKKIDEAFVFFGGKNEAALDELKLLVYDNDSIYESYQVFQKNLNQVRLSIFKASNVTELISTIDVLFKNQIEFARNFPTLNQSLEANPIISKEPDAMEIIDAIQSATKIGITKFNELSQLPADNILVQEANRLSLWLKLETHV